METLTLGDQLSQTRSKTYANFVEAGYTPGTYEMMGDGQGLNEWRDLVNLYAGEVLLSNGMMLGECKKALNEYFNGIVPPPPEQEYGPNEVSNSTFNTSAGWTYDPALWKISQGALICNGIQVGATEAVGVCGKIASGETYRITMNVSVIEAGAVTAYVGDTDPGGTLSITEPGLYSFEAVAGDSIAQVVVVGDATFRGAIDWLVVQILL